MLSNNKLKCVGKEQEGRGQNCREKSAPRTALLVSPREQGSKCSRGRIAGTSGRSCRKIREGSSYMFQMARFQYFCSSVCTPRLLYTRIEWWALGKLPWFDCGRCCCCNYLGASLCSGIFVLLGSVPSSALAGSQGISVPSFQGRYR